MHEFGQQPGVVSGGFVFRSNGDDYEQEEWEARFVEDDEGGSVERHPDWEANYLAEYLRGG